MKDTNLVNALREHAEWARANEWETPITLGDDDAAFTLQAVTDAIGKTPEKALLRMIYARLGDGKSEGYFRSYWNSYTMKHEENEKLDRIYALLVKLGYEMSDDEKALQDGTHELFGEVTDE